ncbi:hypothetical protein [Antarctobacter jejuensis]|uniref:hypothetical protein n=1 Tax=Antarctobacter jejuensis TaxID=1439938 RepID=UPI003FD27807
MFGIFARSFMTATGNRPKPEWPTRHDLPKLSWLEEDLPFRGNAGHRGGRDD